jgi:hypothetical protein
MNEELRAELLVCEAKVRLCSGEEEMNVKAHMIDTVERMLSEEFESTSNSVLIPAVMQFLSKRRLTDMDEVQILSGLSLYAPTYITKKNIEILTGREVSDEEWLIAVMHVRETLGGSVGHVVEKYFEKEFK